MRLRMSNGHAQPRRRLLLFGSHDGEHGSLGIEAEYDPQVPGYLVWSHEHLTVLLLDASVCSINIFDVEVVEPEGHGRIRGIARHYCANRRPAVVEDSVRPHGSHVHRSVLV